MSAGERMSREGKGMRTPAREEVREFLREIRPEIEELCSRYETRRAALIPLLHRLRRRFGFLPPVVQREAAFVLGIAPGDVSRVVGFYSLFREKPCGRQVIMVCGTLSCALRGANKVIETFKEVLGVDLREPTPDGEFSIERVECLGWCDKAPVVQVNDSDYYDNVKPEDVADLVERWRKEPHE